MDPSHAPFMAAILADVDSDGPRLRYADFLDETGEEVHRARAEFIRVQCALEGMERDDPRYEELGPREGNLLNAYWRLWFDPVRAALGEVAFMKSGGFARWRRVETFELKWSPAQKAFVIRSNPLARPKFSCRAHFRRGFVEEMTIGDANGAGRMPDFVAVFSVTPLSAINFEGDEFAVAFLLHANRTGQLRSLRLFARYSDKTIRKVADSPASSHLKHLAVRSMNTTDVAADFDPLSALLAGKHLTGLRHLELNLVSRTPCDLSRLIGSSLLARLKILHIRSPSSSPEFLAELLQPEAAPALGELWVNTRQSLPSSLVDAIGARFGRRYSLSFFLE